LGVHLDLYEGIVSYYVQMLNSLIAKPFYSFVDASSRDVPKTSGVYVISDKRMDTIIYAGRTKNLKRRLLSDHRRGNIRGSQFRKALGHNFDFKSEGEITSYILENCSFQFLPLKTLKNRETRALCLSCAGFYS
jgi:hypothetical protein